jgi:hypothetical protein
LGGFDSGIINFDYSFPEIGLTAYGPGAAAIGFSGDLWNSRSAANPIPPLLLHKADGTPTSVTWSVSTGGGGGNPNTTGAYARLMDADTAIYSATISNLTPNQNYELYLFSGPWAQIIRVNDVDYSTAAYAHYGVVDTLTAGVNYEVHTVASDPAGTLSFLGIYSEFNGAPSITSWQLTPIPEPAAFSLLGLGSLAVLMVRRWR